MDDRDPLTVFHVALAEWRLGRKPIEDIPAAALEALVGGTLSPTLAQLAGMDGASWSEITPVAERVVNELGGPSMQRDAKVLVADAWLGEIAASSGKLNCDYGYRLAQDVLDELGGEYEWFRQAIFDLELLGAMEDIERLECAEAEVRRRASDALSRSPAERLAAPTTQPRERPLLS